MSIVRTVAVTVAVIALLAALGMRAFALMSSGSTHDPPTATKTALYRAPIISINNNNQNSNNKSPQQAPLQQQQQPSADPWSVVQEYYADINAHNYPAAWALTGNGNLGNGSYNAFVNGYDLTESATVSENWESGDTADVNITAVAFTGSAPGSPAVTQTFTGTYTVDNGIITGANVIQTS